MNDSARRMEVEQDDHEATRPKGTGKAGNRPASRPGHPFAGLRSVGPATRRDLDLLGVHTLAELAAADPQELYDRLCAVTGQRHDPCVLDVFACAVAQARDPHLPAARRDWFAWTPHRKAGTLPAALPPRPGETSE
ncbi:helix-hairpin-helix domain-containing protein [Nitratidesulfovibrio oxamicus]|uniref:helix-hairpin-helix domain-containing protein n=1 Tax=Nitratidesulfovibrio oxamicus TaxID=32016 RepID=UPI0018C5EB05|nr:helix-hairpin-helix domain-containing protein [Nitratidesulfovibrio oxamicus]